MKRESRNAGLPIILGMGCCYAMGTFTDNFYKQAAILLAAAAGLSGIQSLATVLFSLPFVLFSAWAGAIADRVSKRSIVLAVKSLECLCMFLGALALVGGSWPGILTVVFLMAVQSAFFSPAINGAIPEHFAPTLVPRVNALIKLASTAAILAGFAAAGPVLELSPTSWAGLVPFGESTLWQGEGLGRVAVGACVVLMSLVGLGAALALPRSPAANRAKAPFPWLGPLESLRQIYVWRKDRELSAALWADAAFYGISAVIVVGIANLSATLGYSKTLGGLLMTLLMVGLALGALLGGRAPVERWRRALFPCGVGMSLCLLLAAAAPVVPSLPVTGVLDTRLIWCAGTLFMAGLFGGRYLIPVESFIQVRPPAAEKGQVIALSNFLAFLAMALFGASFKLVGMLHPSATFVIYASAMLLFVALLRGDKAAGQGGLATQARCALGTALKLLLSLRYKVKESGLEGLKAQGAEPGQPGLLILPNHPAMIDPVLIYSRLAGLRPRPLSDAAQMRGFVQSRAARFLNAVIIPDLDPQANEQNPGGRAAAERVRQGLDMIADTLRQGHTVLLYPAGRIQRDGRERLGNAGAVARLLKEAPETRVLLARTSGLWGSSFSWASGTRPRFMTVLWRGLRTLLGNLIIFTPRRRVHISFAEPADLPRDGNKLTLNQYMEAFYNQDNNDETAIVRRFFWSPSAQQKMSATPYAAKSEETIVTPRDTVNEGAIVTPLDTVNEGAGASCPCWGRGGKAPTYQSCQHPVSPSTCEQVYALLREKGGLPADRPLNPELSLADDLHLDSLALMEAALEIEARFGHAVSRPEALRSVGDCLRLAAGELAEADSAQGEGEIAAIAVPETWTKPPTDADAPFTIPQGARNMLESFFMLCREAPRRPLTAERAASDDGPRARVRTRRDILTAVLALAEALGKLPGERLGIMLPAVPAALVAWLATLRAGKTPVLLNWTVGARNLADNLVLSGCQTVVGSAVLFERLRQTRSLPDDDSGTGRGVRWLPLEEVAAGLSWPVKARAFLRAALHCSSFPYSLRARKVSDTAAVLFTSGSETRPKGVPLSHANIMSNAADVLSVLGLARRDRVLAMLPPFHSFGLLVGLALPATVGMPAAYHANPTESAQCDAAIQDFQVSLLGAAPSFLDGMLNKARGGNTLDSLRYAFVGAESCPDRVRELFERLCPQAALCEGYGITECSPVVAVNRPGDETSGGVGKLLLSMEAALVRESDEAEQGGAAMPTERVTEGETGMLLLRGPNVFSGYLPRTDGEAVPDPFVEFEGKRWYRSGDLLAADAAGNLHFRGRRKRFVKIGGEMISLPLMEEVLCRAFVDRVGQARSDGGTADAGKPFLAVTATREGDGERVEIVVHSVVPVTLDEVNQALRQGGLSPLYAARRLRLVEEIPLLGSGKTDYRALE